MFEESGLKIAMGNAEEMLKQRADYVTSSNRHDGAAEATVFYRLNPELAYFTFKIDLTCSISCIDAFSAGT